LQPKTPPPEPNPDTKANAIIMNDIRDAADVQLLIDTFYKKAVTDPEIGYIFTEVAKTDFAHHLPVMYSFWNFLLLGEAGAYQGNPMQKHVELHAKHPLKAEHFDRWVALFTATVDELFAGKTADDAKFRAFSIAETWKFKFDPKFG
jgi:hemoglobin